MTSSSTAPTSPSTALLVFLLALLTGVSCTCDQGAHGTRADDAVFPHALVLDLLDRTPVDAMERVRAYYPDASTTQTPLRRAIIDNDPMVHELILFTDIRSNRVNTVIVKHHADLPDATCHKIYESLGIDAQKHRDALDAGERVETTYKHLTLRARRRDKNGRLSITIEGNRSSGDSKQK